MLAFIIATMAAVVFGFTQDHIIQQQVDGELLWNDKEADVFLAVVRVGWRGSRLDFAWRSVENNLGVATPSDDLRPSGIVLHITLDNVVQYDFSDSLYGAKTVFENHVYFGSQWRWTGAGFERVSRTGQQKFLASQHPFGEFSDKGGWSRRCCILTTDSSRRRDFDFMIAGQRAELTVVVDKVGRAIELKVANRERRRIWSFDERPRHVGKQEYDRFLGM